MISLESAEDVFKVYSSNSTRCAPQTIEEVRRILLENLKH
jgi:hypothetical protein